MNINLIPALPEIFLSGMILLILLVDAFKEHDKSLITALTGLSILVTMVLQYIFHYKTTQLSFNYMFRLDAVAYGMKMVTYTISIILIFYLKSYVTDKKLPKGEFYVVFLFALLGMMVMMSANNLLVLYVGLELFSLALYTLVALNRDSAKSTEAAIKFFILGALASGLLLFGISFIYGATYGQLRLDYIFGAINGNAGGYNYALLIFGLVFIVAGLAFKLGLVPFHMWIPDVYEGAPIGVTMIIGTVTKIAAVVFVVRFLINALVGLSHQWSLMLAVLGVLSLFIGNIVAIPQTNIKRMLGYSTISHMGFIAFGLMTISVLGVMATFFYVITYVLSALACFGVLTVLSRGSYECETIADLKGLNSSHPVYAGILMLSMFSMAGIPPLVGFYAKFQILQALISAGHLKIAVYAVIMSLIGAFYYLRIVKVMYFDDNAGELRPADTCITTKSILFVNGALLLLIGIMPVGTIDFCTRLVTN
jgi:NADH-quinone oxidoreductase subunit N